MSIDYLIEFYICKGGGQYYLGGLAAKNGSEMSDNPNIEGTLEYEAWSNGWWNQEKCNAIS